MTETRRRLLQAAALSVLGAGAGTGAARAQTPGAALPRPVQWPAQVQLLDGRVLDAQALNARPVVLVFWSTTCAFCQRHNVHVEKLHRAAAGSALLVLGVAVDAQREAVLARVRQRGYSFPITQNSDALAAMFEHRRVVPRTYAVDAGSRLVSALAGEMSEDDVMEFLRLARRAA